MKAHDFIRVLIPGRGLNRGITTSFPGKSPGNEVGGITLFLWSKSLYIIVKWVIN